MTDPTCAVNAVPSQVSPVQFAPAELCWENLRSQSSPENIHFVFAPPTGVSSLSIQFAKLPKGLKHLNLSKTSLSPKGMLQKYASFSLLKLSHLHTKSTFSYQIIK